MSALDALAEAWGILPRFHDLSGIERPTAPETKRALLRANGVDAETDAQAAEALAETHAFPPPRETVVPVGTVLAPEGDWWLTLEDGTETEGRGRIPALPSGLHVLDTQAGTVLVIAAPTTAPSVEQVAGRPRLWGVNAALYGMRAAGNGGFGNFADLARAAQALAAHGADFVGINPVHAIGWADRQTRSPYSPTHRGFLDTAHIALDGAGPGPDGETVDRVAFLHGHRDRLEAEYAAFAGDDGFERFRTEGGDPLHTFALYEALSETHGADWRRWPPPLQDRDSPEVATAAQNLADRIRFHQWLQWHAETQLAQAQGAARAAGMGLGLYLDLAVGARRGGAESWCEQGSTARGVSLGAPPDHFAPDGQDWGLSVYGPHRLAGLCYAPWRRIVRAAMRHAGVLRIDHVLGLARGYWIPDDGSPGGYVRQSFDTLLALVAIEAERAGTVVIGEDLGLVPDGFREALGARGLYGYSVLQYERDGEGRLRDPAHTRADVLLCFGTHDTPTLRGFREGRDIGWWRRLGWIDDGRETEARAQRARDVETLYGFGGVHAALAAAPAAMVSVQMDDLCDEAEAQNLPGTVGEHPNWQRRCSVPVEGLADDPALRETGEIMRRHGRGR